MVFLRSRRPTYGAIVAAISPPDYGDVSVAIFKSLFLWFFGEWHRAWQPIQGPDIIFVGIGSHVDRP